MNNKEFIAGLSLTFTKNNVNQLSAFVLEADFPLNDLIDLTFHEERKIGFHAAWVLETVFLMKPLVLVPHLAYFIQRFPEQRNPSARRHFAKIAAVFSAPKTALLLEKKLEGLELDQLIEALFSWLIDEKVAVAVKVHSMQALANLSGRYLWVREELLETLKFFSDRERKAFFSRSKQIQKLLSK